MNSLPVLVLALLVGVVVGVAAWRLVGARLSDALLLAVPLTGIVGLGVAGLASLTPAEPAISASVVLVLVASFGVVRALDRPRGRWMRRLRARLLFGVPWGSLISVLGVLGFYLYVQGGANHLYSPVTLPFTSWSYYYPLGVLTAPFAHTGYGHLYGNLLGTVVLAPVAEYAFSHFPTERGDSAFSSLRTNPYVRAFLVFPLGVFLVGIATSLLAWGPIIGFSGVVFAFAAFGLTRYPITVVVALSLRSVVSTVYTAITDPVSVASASSSFGGPWWAGIAIQGHFVGLALGVLLGVLVFSKREGRPSAARLFAGAVLFAASLSLYAFWWYRGPSTYVLYRGVGVAFVLLVGWIVAAAVRARDTDFGFGFTRRQAAVLGLVLPLLVVAMVAVPVNLTTVSQSGLPSDSVHVDGYTVGYAENVPNQRVSSVRVSLFGETTSVNASGVIVYDPGRELWTQAVSASELAFYGARTVRVGGVGWRDSVTVQRLGWVARGGPTTYNVYLKPGGGDWRAVYSSDAATADATIDGKNVTVFAQGGAFGVAVTRENETLARDAIPARGNATTLAGIRFVHDGTRLIAVADGTRVPVAHEESYE